MDFRDELAELLTQRVVVAGTEAEDDVVKAAEPFLGAVLPLDLDVVVSDLQHLGVYIDVNPVLLRSAHERSPVGHAHACEDLGQHLNCCDGYVTDARVEDTGEHARPDCPGSRTCDPRRGVMSSKRFSMVFLRMEPPWRTAPQ